MPFTINVKLTPNAEKAVKEDIDDLRSLVAETFEADDDSKLRQQAIETIEANVADYSTDENVSPYWGDGIANPNKYIYFKLRYAWNNHPDIRETIIEQ